MRVYGSGFRVQGTGFRVYGSGFRVQGSGFRVQGSGFRVDPVFASEADPLLATEKLSPCHHIKGAHHIFC